MRLVLLKEIPEDADLRRQWNALVLRMEPPQVFYTYEWALAMYRAYRTTLPPLLFLAYENDGLLCGVATLATAPDGRGASFLGATTGDYCDFISIPELRDAFVSAVLAELRKQNIAEIALANLPASSASVRALHGGARGHGYRCFARTAYMCAQVSLGALERSKEGKPVLPRKRMVHRFLKAMEREAPVRTDHARSWNAIEPLLPKFMHTHVARFLTTGRISNMARSERRNFLGELAKLLSEPGWLIVSRLMVGEKTAAWHYGFQYCGVWNWYQLTFDGTMGKYSPGFCLLSRMIEDASQDPAFTEIDLGLGAEDYKEQLANHTRETLYVTLKTSPVFHYREIVRYRLASAIKASPPVEAKVRFVTAKLQRVKNRVREQGVVKTFFWLANRLRRQVWGRTEVCFYEWHGCVPESSVAQDDELGLQSLSLDYLATAVTEYVEDPEAQAYLLRAARRLTSEDAEGFVLVNQQGSPLHFAWINRFEGFFVSELNAKVEAASSNDVLLFDCWTPAMLRGRGYYAQAIERLARRAVAAGKRPWIFSASTNMSSVHGLAKAGFQRRYSLVYKKCLWRQSISGQPPVAEEVHAAEVSARV